MEKNNKMAIPGAIIIAGAIIAVSIIAVNFSPQKKVIVQEKVAPAEQSLPPITSDDRILGNPDANLIMVEYADSSCPVCKSFNVTVKRVMDLYGKDGKVALVYRHFPLNKPNDLGQILHPNAGKEAIAFECAFDQGGNEKFYQYLNKFYETTDPAQTQLTDEPELAKLMTVAKAVSLDANKFNSCLSSGKYDTRVEDQYQGGIVAGVTGTPNIFLVVRNTNKIVPIYGAVPFSALKASVDALLK